MDLPLHAKVYCFDGLCGQSKELVLDRNREEVTHLVVKGNNWPHTEVLVPVQLVEEATQRSIRLRCTRDKLKDLEPLVQAEFIKAEIPQYLPGPYLMSIEVPDTKWVAVKREVIPDGKIAVRQGARVEATDGHVGRLGELLVDPVTGKLTHLVLREGHLWGQRQVAIPVSEIDRLEQDTVYLRLNKSQVGQLQQFHAGVR